LSRLQEVDLVFPIFFSHFLLFLICFTVFLFLELGLGLEQQGHKLHNEQKDIEGSGRDDVIPCAKHMVI